MTDATSATTASSTAAAATTNTGTASTNASNLASGQANLDTSYSTFLTLLTTQLKNQDPTSPLDTNQFTQQLVQMTGVQQQLLSNELLQQLVSQNGGAGGVTQATSLIGKTVNAAASKAVLSGGQANWSYTLPQDAAKATLTVTDAGGRTVWTGPASGLGAGRHDFTWNGQSSSGVQQADGSAFTLTVTASDSAGATVTPTTEVRGVVSSVELVNGSPVLNIGKTQVPYSSVTAVNTAASS